MPAAASPLIAFSKGRKMPKLWLTGLILLLMVGGVAAQTGPRLSSDERQQIQRAIVQLYAAEAEVLRIGTLLTPDHILTEFYGLEMVSSDYACDVSGHSTIQATQTLSRATAEACLLFYDVDHNFALLQVETWNDRGGNAQRAAPPGIEIREYSSIKTRVYTPLYENMSAAAPLKFEAGTITNIPTVPSEPDGEILQQRHYLSDFQSVVDETLGGPVVDDNGTIVGITNGINVDPQGERQFVRVVPLTTICRVNTEVCALIQPPALFPPQDRTQVPNGVELINTGEIDFKTRITNLCKAFSMKGDLADTESGWACWRSSGNTIGLELGVLEIDMICQETYADMTAFALLSGPDEEMAYRWRCYRPQN